MLFNFEIEDLQKVKIYFFFHGSTGARQRNSFQKIKHTTNKIFFNQHESIVIDPVSDRILKLKF